MRALVASRKRGGPFDRVLMLGRQRSALPREAVGQALEEAGLPRDTLPAAEAFDGWAEPLFQALGAREVHAMDASDFEGAAFVHDLNRPPAPELLNRFDLVFDGGTLEHVFDLPTALRGVLGMVAVDGRFLSQNPAFGFAGHGFWQFAPELWFRVLGEGSGYALERMLLLEHFDGGSWYRVADPETVRGRVEIGGAVRCLLHVEARRQSADAPLAFTPQQSDYAASWSSGRERRREGARGQRLRDRVPGLAAYLARRKATRLLAKLAPARQPSRFQPTDFAAECAG